MPLTALAWNIEQFGSKFARYKTPSTMEAVRRRLVAAVVAAAKADVVVIQELRKDGIPLLKLLAAEIKSAYGTSTAWHYDWLPGSQTTSPSTGYPSLFSQLGFTQPGNNEGYAVLWRDGALVPFTGSTLSAGIDTPDPNASNVSASRARYLGMVFRGRPLLFDDPNYDITYDANGAFKMLGFPFSLCPAKNITLGLKGRTVNSNKSLQNELKVRRPCCVSLGVTSSRTVPLIVFHAPVGQQNSRSPRYGTLMGFASEQLQVTDCVYAGDFNVIGAGPQKTLNQYPPTLTPPYVANTYVNGAPARSVVHYLDNDGDFRTGTAVFGNARDFAFARAPASAPTLTVRNVLGLDITPTQGAVRTSLAAMGATAQKKVATEMLRWDSQDTVDVFNDYLAGKPPRHGADNQTAAAIVYRVLMSDHLPVMINFA